MNIDNIRCVFEFLIPVAAWLAKVFAGKKQATAESAQPEGSGVMNAQGQPEGDTPTGSLSHTVAAEPDLRAQHRKPRFVPRPGTWAAHLKKQISPQSAPQGLVAQPAVAAVTGLPSVGSAPVGSPGLPRWLHNFGPGALGALIATIGFVVALPLSGPALGFQDKGTIQVLIIAELVCLPFPLVAGGFIGVLASLLAKTLAKAIHMGERAQVATSMMAGVISGTVTGVLCGVLTLFAAVF